ncbi:MAG: response regulator [Chloroflexota bacterium]|nr:response regulator [Chloroflexota bacterium]
MKILVVDDEPDVANLVRMGIVYQRPEYEIVESHSGTDALERAARERFDVVILDLTMPEIDGFTVLGALRGGGSIVPIIVLTARGAEQDRVRPRAWGGRLRHEAVQPERARCPHRRGHAALPRGDRNDPHHRAHPR